MRHTHERQARAVNPQFHGCNTLNISRVAVCSSCHSAHSSASASNGNHYRHVLLETYRAGCAMSMSAIISITLASRGGKHTHSTHTYRHTGVKLSLGISWNRSKGKLPKENPQANICITPTNVSKKEKKKKEN